MCYTPTISLITAIVEFSVAIFILMFFKKSRINLFFVIFLFFLGMYQFSEFMICSFGNPFIWAKIGFISYTFLPAIGLYSVLRIINRNYQFKKLVLLYLVPVFFTIYAILNKNFILGMSCEQYFIVIKNSFSCMGILFGIYVLYYFGYLFLTCMFLWGKIVMERNKSKKLIEIDVLLAIIFSLLSAVFLIIIIPSLSIEFPSIYCQFAILFAFAAIVGAWIDSKRLNNGKRK